MVNAASLCIITKSEKCKSISSLLQATRQSIKFLIQSAALLFFIALLWKLYFDHRENVIISELMDACNSSLLNSVPESNPTRGDRCYCEKIDNYYHGCLTKVEVLNWQPFLAIYHDVYRPVEIEAVAEEAMEKPFTPSLTISEYGFAYSGLTRHSTEAFLTSDLPIVQYIWAVAERATQTDAEGAFLKALNYEKGGMFQMHQDGAAGQRLSGRMPGRLINSALEPIMIAYNYCQVGKMDQIQWISAIRCMGDYILFKRKPYHIPLNNRFGTVLIPLDDSFEGGETVFPDLGVKVKAPNNSLVLFSTIYPDTTVDYRHKHGACEVTSGRKLVLQGRLTFDGNSLGLVKSFLKPN